MSDNDWALSAVLDRTRRLAAFFRPGAALSPIWAQRWPSSVAAEDSGLPVRAQHQHAVSRQA